MKIVTFSSYWGQRIHFASILMIITHILMLETPLSAKTSYIKIEKLPGFISHVEVPEVTPMEIFQWFLTMDNDKFTSWHPAHREYRIVHKTEDMVGSKIFFHEVIDGFEIKWTWEIIKINIPDTLIFKRVGFPVYWVLILNPSERGTFVTNSMRYGTGWRCLDRFLEWVVQLWYLKPETQQAIDNHDREEFLLLSSLVIKGEN